MLRLFRGNESKTILYTGVPYRCSSKAEIVSRVSIDQNAFQLPLDWWCDAEEEEGGGGQR